MSVRETETLELKKSLAQLREGVISLSAMLNKHNIGTVIFGINDEGRICGVDMGRKTKSDIAHEIRNELKPLPSTINIDDYIDQGKRLIKVEVKGSDTPYSAYNRYFIRLNDADIPMDSNQLQSYFESMQDTYSRWEETETPYCAEDIDENLLLDMIRAANEKGRMQYIYRNAKEALIKFGLLTKNEKLNNAGWYLFGNNQPLTIKEANFPTDSRSDFGEIKEYSGNIFDCIHEVMSYIRNHISFKSNIIGIQREEVPEIPIRAIREIVINSFAHCSYARQGDFNQYTIYRSSIQIYNPGSIIKGIDPKNFAKGLVGSKIRNILIASTLYKCGYIDAFGTGFDRTFTECANAGVDYHYREDEFGFTFIFERNPQFLEDSTSINLTSAKESPVEYAILKQIREDKYITVQELSERIGKSTATISRYIRNLTDSGKLKRIGARKNGYWFIQ